MSELQRITIDPEQCGGRPCIQKLRIIASDVLDLRASGTTSEEVLADYPSSEDVDISTVSEYTARQLNHRVLRIAKCVFSFTRNCLPVLLVG